MPQTRSAILFSVDGMRPDGLHKANTPNVDSLIENGAYTHNARTTMPSVTLPCHQSMFRAVPSERHGIVTNTFTPLVRPVPSVIDAVHRAKRKTASFYNWEQLRDLSDPGSLTLAVFMEDCYTPEGDFALAKAAAKAVEDEDYGFAFVYLGYTDTSGHASGWMSEPYIDAVSNADGCIGAVMDAVRASGRWDETTFIVTADHGGHGQTHGTDADEDMLIPWVACGPGIPSNREIVADVSIMDTPPTITALLGVEPGEHWMGKPVADVVT